MTAAHTFGESIGLSEPPADLRHVIITPGPPAHAAFFHPVSAAVRPSRGLFTQNKSPGVAPRCVVTAAHTFGESVGLSEPPADLRDVKVKVTP